MHMHHLGTKELLESLANLLPTMVADAVTAALLAARVRSDRAQHLSSSANAADPGGRAGVLRRSGMLEGCRSK